MSLYLEAQAARGTVWLAVDPTLLLGVELFLNDEPNV